MTVHDAPTVPAMPQRPLLPGPQRTREISNRPLREKPRGSTPPPVKPKSTPRPKSKIKPMTPGIPHNARLRAYLAGALVTAGILGAAWRAWGLQVDNAGHFRELAERQHGAVVDIPAPRGEVLDVHGNPLAVSADADSIWANPREIRDVTETAAKLASLLDEEPAVLEAKLGGDRRFVWIDRHVAPETAGAVRAAKLAGIEVAREPRRWYPAKSLLGPVIGRSDIDGKGLDGIELAMNTYLTGTRGAGKAVRDARGRKLFADGMAQPEPGATVQLTIDRTIQALAEKAIADSVTTNMAKSGTVVVLDVATSRVLAMASYPTFDPNGAHDPEARNRAVTDTYEAGSVMKVFSVSAALDEGVVRPDTEFDVMNGAYRIGRKTIRDVHPEKYLTVSGIIKHSSNVGTVMIAQRLGKERLDAALRRFGFAAKTKIELPGEQSGRLRPGAKWKEIEQATISFGYGLTITPLQLAAGIAAIGNDGMYRAPRIVDRVLGGDGELVYQGTSEPRQVIKPKTAQQMQKMLASVFEGGKKGGTAKGIVVPGFRCAGKTGTAHKYDPVAHKYAEDRYLSSFAGLAPATNPRLAIVVLVDEPSGGDYFGGLVAGPVFATVASEALRYLGEPGESLVCPPPVPGVNPALLSVVPPKVCTIAAPKPAKPGAKPVPEPAVEEPEPPDVAPIDGPMDPGEPLIAVPDFRGTSVKRALDLARAAHLEVVVKGSGKVIEQQPPPGPATEVSRVILRFSDGDSPIH